MKPWFLTRIAELSDAGQHFVTATVVSRRAPVSSHLGDRALVLSDGRMEGFVGGSCSHDIVRKQALEVLRLGTPRLVLIRPDASEEAMQHAANAESIVVPMTCASEGAVDIYLEPHLPARWLLVVGFTPVAGAVAKLGDFLGYKVRRVVTAEDARDLDTAETVLLPELPAFLAELSTEARAGLAAVVASQGHYDEPALEALLLAEVGFVSLLASRKRAVTVRELLELQGLSAAQVAQIRNPAGLDIGAKTPPEVAVSILAEVIAARNPALAPPMFTHSQNYDAGAHRAAAQVSQPTQTQTSQPRPGYAISPVDGEEIEIASAVHFADLDGVRYYFTCPNCKRRFLKDPAKFLTSNTEQAR